MIEEKVYFRNWYDEKICGLIARPEGDGKFPVVVGCHGFTANKNGSKLTELSKRLPEEGIALLRFDFSGLGESEGDFAETTIGKNAQELHSAIEFVKTLEFVDKDRIGVFGSSMGGMVTLVEASSNPDIKAISLAAPACKFDYPVRHYTPEQLREFEKTGIIRHKSSNGRIYEIKWEFIKEARSYDMLQMAQDIKADVLIVQGDSDKSCAHENAMEFIANVSSRKELITLNGCGHFFEEHDFDLLIDFTTEFFKNHLLHMKIM